MHKSLILKNGDEDDDDDEVVGASNEEKKQVSEFESEKSYVKKH